MIAWPSGVDFETDASTRASKHLARDAEMPGTESLAPPDCAVCTRGASRESGLAAAAQHVHAGRPRTQEIGGSCSMIPDEPRDEPCGQHELCVVGEAQEGDRKLTRG
jgi:hypothetical protein